MATRSQRLDQSISDAMHDLPIPTGSVDRLLAKLNVPAGPAKPATAANATSATASASATPPGPLAPSSANPANGGAAMPSVATGKKAPPEKNADDYEASSEDPPGRSSPRRKWKLGLIEVSVFVLVASLGAVAYFFTGSQVAYNADQIVGEVKHFADNEQPDDWQPIPASAPPAILAKFPFAAGSGLTVKPTSWRHVRDLLSRSGVAYDLRSGAIAATLYVVELDPPNRFAPRFEHLAAAAPTTALVDSGGWAVSTWAQGDLLYVLVVKGGPQHYKAFVAQPGPLALL
jgi:hypothetical protein